MKLVESNLDSDFVSEKESDPISFLIGELLLLLGFGAPIRIWIFF